MTTEKQIQIANVILAGGLVKKVFHSVQLLKDKDRSTLYPVYKKGAEYTYAGIDDTHGLFAYIRTNGDVSGVPLKIQSCGRSYQMSAPLRIVFFNDNEDRDFEALTNMLAPFTFLQHVTLTRIITDKYRLVQEESPMFRENFDGKTYYTAFDIFVSVTLQPNSCEQNNCSINPNPLLPCPVAAPQSIGSVTS